MIVDTRMPEMKKQMKITKLFRKGAFRRGEDYEELQDEIKGLEQRLREKQNEFFQVLRNNCKQEASHHNTKDVPFVHPEKIVLTNSVETLKSSVDLMWKLSGVQVESYKRGDHVCVMFHMQDDSHHAVRHGLRLDLHDGSFKVSRSSMPFGFNLNAVLSEFDKVIEPPCLRAVRRALVAFYRRLRQYDALKELLHADALLFRAADGTHIQISFYAQRRDDEDDHIPVTLMLDYRTYDVMPKTFFFKENELPEDVAEVLKSQCVSFKDKPLHRAFKQAFLDDLGPYGLIHQTAPRQEQHRARPAQRPRPNHRYNMDDTYQPEDCSDLSELSDEH